MSYYDIKKAYNNMLRKRGPINEAKGQDLEERVIDFLDAYPNPSDKIVHDFAEEIGVEVDKIEEEIYKLATKFVRFWKGGKWNTVSDDFKYDEEQLKMGIEVEMEHTPDPEVARKISLDHLVEIENYYTLLAEMEKNAKESE